MSKLFNDLSIHEEIKTVLKNRGFTLLTDVQASVIPEFMKKDVIVQSQTGSGKTLSYLIPILNYLYSSVNLSMSENMVECKNHVKYVTALVIVPTRELCIQIDEILKIFKFRSEIFIGGTKIEEDLAKFKNLDRKEKGSKKFDIKSIDSEMIKSKDSEIGKANVDELKRSLEESFQPNCKESFQPNCKESFQPNCKESTQPNCKESTQPNCKESTQPNCKESTQPNCKESFQPNCKESFQPNLNNFNEIVNQSDYASLNPISIAIGTPGRLQEIISSNSKAFSKVKFVVLDESDKLLSFGFESKLLRILQFLPKNRITGLFSATINESVTKLSMSFLKNPISIRVTEQIPEKLSIKYLVLSPKEKLETLVDLILNKKSILFFSTCNTVDYFYELFIRIFNNSNDMKLKLHKIHGIMDQRDRNQIYSQFEKLGGSLFCTDVAARGIDFKNVDLVIHFDFPKDYENIVHRSGRTARNGHSGDSVIFLMPNETSVVDFLKLKGITIEKLEKTVITDESNNKRARLLLEESPNENLTVVERCKSVIDKNLIEISVKSFVSYVRGYKEHILNYILNYKELDFDELAEIHFLEKIPSMAELRNVKFKNYEKPETKSNKK